MVTRAIRRHQQMLAKVRRRRMVMEAYGYEYWVEPSYRGSYQHQWSAGSPFMSESGHKHWRKVQMTAPNRAQEHQQLRLVAKGIEADAFRWPDHKKPFVYYW